MASSSTRVAAVAAAILAAAIGAASMAAAPAAAQEPAPASAPAAAPLQAERVANGLYLIRGGGANTLVRFTGAGVVLVDAKAPGNFHPLMSQVHKLTKLSDAPVRALLLTSGEAAHAGNVAALETAGARVVADRALAARLPPAPASAVAPRVAFDGDYSMRLGGVTLQLRHVEGLHPGGDTVVLFPDLRVLAIGDLLTPDAQAPGTPDDAQRRRAAIGAVLALDFDRAVPADGPPVPRAQLEQALAALGPA